MKSKTQHELSLALGMTQYGLRYYLQQIDGLQPGIGYRRCVVYGMADCLKIARFCADRFGISDERKAKADALIAELSAK